MLFDALEMRFREVRLRRDPSCPICGDSPTIHELIDYDQFCGVAPAVEEPEEIGEITVQELKEEQDAGRDILVLDVRNPYELDICRLEGSYLIPLGELMERVAELNPNQDIVVHCKSGARSAEAIRRLKTRGFVKLRNLTGGILAWADQIDPAMPKY